MIDITDPYQPNDLFDLEDLFFREIFHSLLYVWEALPRINDFIKHLPLGKIDSPIPKGVHLENSSLITIEKNCIIEPTAFVKGPCFIGEGTHIRHGAYVRGNVITGKKCVIGHVSEVKNALLLNGAQAAHFAYVGDSILGNNVNLGAGTKLANLKFDHSNIMVLHKNQKLNTGLKKFGAIFGDGAQSGCNAVTNPGTVLGKEAYCIPCSNVNGYIPPGYGFIAKDKLIPPKLKRALSYG
jgi:NDP-sugar pyrophosphorylase family protein